MFTRINSKPVKMWAGSLICAAIVVITLAMVFAPKAFAKLAANTVNTIATVSHNGRHIRLTGPVACDQTQPVFMRVTVTQRSTGAIAEGYAYFIGSIVTQQWQVHAINLGSTKFVPGPATAVALARTTTSSGNGGPDDAHQWLVNVTLVEE